jgi:hypothetical protein
LAIIGLNWLLHILDGHGLLCLLETELVAQKHLVGELLETGPRLRGSIVLLVTRFFLDLLDAVIISVGYQKPQVVELKLLPLVVILEVLSKLVELVVDEDCLDLRVTDGEGTSLAETHVLGHR